MTMPANIPERLALAEASAWLVRLQGSERTPEYEAAFREWLAEDVAHARAFEKVTNCMEHHSRRRPLFLPCYRRATAG